METSELLKKVRKVELKTKGTVSQLFSGEYHSAFKGRGMAFSEVREYQPGDEIRSIDWNVTARMNHPYVKVFEEERELLVMLLADVSASCLFGSTRRSKKELLTEVSAVLAYSAIRNNDKAGMILFSDRIEKFIPPGKGRSHILRIIRELIDAVPVSKGTDIAAALRFLNNVVRKRAVVFVLSDFMSPEYEALLHITSRKHDVIAIQVSDHREAELPDAGLLQVTDPETGRMLCLDTSSAAVRARYAAHHEAHRRHLAAFFQAHGIDTVSIGTNDNYVRALMTLFERRTQRK